ncbi:MAG: glycoside hydrolase family 3 C-terminal domain-containing protein [Muribaculaceae bacterium]|nr:glycoside hydrolase family 3 C-terminal domain-containing protein [Muribaculaceae bacterium]
MRKIELLLTGVLAAGILSCGRGGAGSDGSPAIPVDRDIETKVKEIVSGMSLEDKVGQMCEVVVDLVCADSLVDGKVVLDDAKLDTVFNKYRVGSILNTAQGHAQDRETWYRLINGIQEASMKYIGVPDIFGVDQNHGTTYTIGGTLFPQEINMAASFNRDLVREGAAVCAYESRASSIPWVYNPVMDLGRNPVWSRIWESFGEDPYINGEMAVEMVKGYQGDDPNHIGVNNVGSCLKHYMAYGNPVSGKDRTPTSINPVDLREKYFQPFKMAIKAGALSVMVNSGINNGLPFHANHEMLTVWLKEDLNWDGMIVTDWADIHNLWKRDKIAADYKEAIMLAINAGIDMSMTPYDMEFCTLLKQLVDEGKVKMDRIDDAVSRIIRFKLRLGLYEHPATNPADYPLFGSKEHARKSFEMAAQSEILLKNENNLLPLAKGKRILLTGPNANTMRSLNGGWSYTWQGTNESVYHEGYNTIYEALCNEYGASNVILEQGMDYVEEYGKWEAEENLRIERAVAAARGADVIVACIGENSYCETPGNTNDLNLSANQTALVKALAKTGKPIVLILNEGRPRIIREIEPLAGAIVDILLPGNYGGDALAKLLSGERNFSAKLPYTYPKWINSLATYDHKPCESVPTMSGAYNYAADIDVQWPFGFGLSYTVFKYSDITIDKQNFTPEDEITVSVKVTNTGDRAGMEPVIFYSSDLIASITPDVLRVRGFDKVSLNPGESKNVDFKIPASALAFVNYDGKWTVEEGEFEFTVGDQKVKANCTATKVWNTPNI